ncbi:MepB family protein [uncultured Flavobacterium sp.]|uniref:MepB family protein n=1 Tax=uncultured Flavobacterium sp. TaxID=165435 RepID=UPI0030C7C95E
MVSLESQATDAKQPNVVCNARNETEEIEKPNKIEQMDKNLNQIKSEIYDKCSLKISDFKTEMESKEYNACRFQLNGLNILSRNAKITPKKVGQFVTFWKRNGNGPIEPFNENDRIDFYTVNVRTENEFGQFVFPKSTLVKKGIMSTEKKEGKRGFRVYPKWDVAKNKQAERTQKWQLNYFYEINDSTDLQKVTELYDEK